MQVFIVLTLALVAAWVVYSKWSDSRRRELPPGPPRLPIFGNIFQFGQNPHKSLAQLAKTYGPLMSVQLGTRFAIVVSSPEIANEVLSKQDLVFSDTSNQDAFRVHDHDQFSIGFSPITSDRWKKIRRIAKERLFSNQALQATKSLRQERLRKLADHVSNCSGEGRAMNVGEATFTAMFNLVFTTLFSVEFIGHSGPRNNALKEHVDGITRYLGLPNISDFFPILAPFDLQGIRRKMGHHVESLLEIIESLIEQRLQERKASSTHEKKNDFLETLLDLMEGNEYDLSIDEIKHLFVDLTLGGSDTSAATTEWTMTELLLHPNKLAKLRTELKSVIGEKRIIEETDISNLPYLQATIKEVLRYHPIAPLLSPHVARHETQINGYKIPKNTRAFVNVWAITRDPSIWKNPECFEPERFLDNKVDFGGRYFELTPFGSGRRICPGMPLANRMLHCMVATLCHNFDWKLEEGAESAQLQREDVFGLSLQKKIPLRAIPVKGPTHAATTEWAMVELLLHPEILAKGKRELKSVIEEKRIIEESDISTLLYLQATTIKEVLRHHPVGPLLNPLEAKEETKVHGYRIPKNAKMIFNSWATSRNQSIWKDPESFEPKRILDNEINFRGQHYELIPFGSGRRIWPGLPPASSMLHGGNIVS